jgi:hypothetical protein
MATSARRPQARLETITGKRGVSIALDAIVGSSERGYAFPSVGEMRGSRDGGWG